MSCLGTGAENDTTSMQQASTIARWSEDGIIHSNGRALHIKHEMNGCMDLAAQAIAKEKLVSLAVYFQLKRK